MMPIHGPWCSSTTWKTRCLGCGEPVFFFQCNCGSRVLFDELGRPWPIHDCETSWTRRLVRRRDATGGISVEISEGVTAYRPPDGAIDESVAQAARRRQNKPDPIVRMEPKDDTDVQIVGVLREKRIDVDVYRSLGLPQTSMSAGFLGVLATDNWSRVTLHCQSHENQILSYTAWAPTEMLAFEIRTGMTLQATLTQQAVPAGSEWICDSLEPI